MKLTTTFLSLFAGAVMLATPVAGNAAQIGFALLETKYGDTEVLTPTQVGAVTGPLAGVTVSGSENDWIINFNGSGLAVSSFFRFAWLEGSGETGYNVVNPNRQRRVGPVYAAMANLESPVTLLSGWGTRTI